MRPLSAAEIAIVTVIRALRAGEVLAYGEVARRAGLPGRARWVARLLAQCAELALPWHRVLRADGRIAFAPGSEGFIEQARRLQAEGVIVVGGRVRMPSSGQSLDAALWAAPRR